MTCTFSAAVRSASRPVCVSLGLLFMSGSSFHAIAQTARPSDPPAASASQLPPVVVSSPAQRAGRTARSARPSGAARRAATRAAPQRAPAAAVPSTVSARETATSPVPGYVAEQSATGTKTDTKLMENPQSVSVVGQDQIDQQGSLTVAESLRYTAGVLAGSRPGNRFDDVFIRGFGGFGFTAGYAQFLDGLKMQRGISYAVPNIDAYGLERVEVIKGPASVLYGQTNPGGLINMVSKRPLDRGFYGEVEALAGNYDRIQSAFDIGGRIDKEGQLLYRVTGLGMQSNTSVDFTQQQRVFIAPTLTWKPTDDTKITFLNHYQNDPKSFQPNYLPAQGLMPGIGGVPANPYGRLPTSFYVGDPSHDSYRREWYSSGYELEHRFDSVWTVRQNFRYQHLNSEFYAIPANPGYTSAANPNQIQRAKTSVVEDFGGAVVDNQAEAKFRTGFIDHKMLFGVDYQHSSAHRLLGQARGVPNLSTINPVYFQNIARAPFTTDQTQTNSNLGLYIQDQMKIDRLIVSLAGRHDRSEIQFNTLTLGTGARNIVNQNDSAFTYRAGALYLLDGGISPYVNYATSFEPAPYLAVGDKPLLPMSGESYEFGVKYQPIGLDTLITASYFDIRQQNVVNGDPLNIGYYVQTGEVRSRGVELEAKTSFSRNLNGIASVTWLDAEVTRDVVAVNVGKRPFAVPAVMASAWADYTFDRGPLGGFGLGGGVRYVGDSAGDPANSFTVPAVTLFDAGVHYDFSYLNREWKGWSARVNANNLFDKEYVAACYTLSNGCFWGARRSVIGSVKYSW